MNETRTTSILQRVPVILAVTAASYGLTLPVRHDTAQPQGHGATVHQKAERADVIKAPRR